MTNDADSKMGEIFVFYAQKKKGSGSASSFFPA
jgi:hypothetical protein